MTKVVDGNKEDEDEEDVVVFSKVKKSLTLPIYLRSRGKIVSDHDSFSNYL